MQTLGRGNHSAANLYWLPFLLTGHRDRSLDVAIDVLAARGRSPEAPLADARGSVDSSSYRAATVKERFCHGLNFQDDANLFFSNWMLAWSRRLVIAKALAAIQKELSASARRTASMRPEKPALPPPAWALDSDTTKVELERALLAIDLFPRCALLLVVFEGVPVEDAAILLDSDPGLVRKAQVIGLQELTHNLAGMQGWTSVTTSQRVLMSEMQHA